MPKVIAYASSKGGVGKTTLATHIAAGFAASGKRVLLVDLDGGAHATTWLLGSRQEVGIVDALIAGELREQHILEVPKRPRLFLAPSSMHLGTVELALAKVFGRERRLAKVLRETRFEVVVIDCPHGTGFLEQSAIFASDQVFVPTLPNVLGLTGLDDMRRLIAQIRKESKARVIFGGCVLFQADERKGITARTRQRLRELEIEDVFASEVRVSTAAEEMPSSRALAWDPGADPRGAEDYRALLQETEARLLRPLKRTP